LVYRGMKTVGSPGRNIVEAVVAVDGRDYYPGVEEFALSNESVPSPAVRSTPADDVYLTFADQPTRPGGPAGISVTVEPLVMWLWTGGGVVLVGGLVTLAPAISRRRRPKRGRLEEATIELAAPEAVGAGVGAPA
jgi:cytochrome c-type biogenesis protein CcmF